MRIYYTIRNHEDMISWILSRSKIIGKMFELTLGNFWFRIGSKSTRREWVRANVLAWFSSQLRWWDNEYSMLRGMSGMGLGPIIEWWCCCVIFSLYLYKTFPHLTQNLWRWVETSKWIGAVIVEVWIRPVLGIHHVLPQHPADPWEQWGWRGCLRWRLRFPQALLAVDRHMDPLPTVVQSPGCGRAIRAVASPGKKGLWRIRKSTWEGSPNPRQGGHLDVHQGLCVGTPFLPRFEDFIHRGETLVNGWMIGNSW